MGKEVVGQRRSARLIARKSKSFMGCIYHKTIDGKGLLRAVNMDGKGKGLKVVHVYIVFGRLLIDIDCYLLKRHKTN